MAENNFETNSNSSEKLKMGVKRKSMDKSDFTIYKVDPGEAEISIGCLVKVQPMRSFQKDQVKVERWGQLENNPIVDWNEELLGNIISISVAKGNTIMGPIQILIPFLHTRNNPSRQPALKVQYPGCKDWTVVDSFESFVDGFKEYRFLEMTMTSFVDCKMAVVAKPKIENFTISSPDNLKLVSAVDPRVTMTFKELLIRKTTNYEIEYQPIDLMAVQEVKRRHGDATKWLLSNSGILNINGSDTYLTITMPIPPPPMANKNKRPSTGIESRHSQPIGTSQDPAGGGAKPRPKTAAANKNVFKFFGRNFEEEVTDNLTLLAFHCPEDSEIEKWTIHKMTSFVESRKKDLVTFEIDRYIPKRLSVIRHLKVGSKMADNEELVRMMELIDRSIKFKSVHAILKQKETNAKDLSLNLVGPLKLDRVLRKMADEGYKRGPPISSVLSLKEGDVIELKFRGNVISVGVSEDGGGTSSGNGMFGGSRSSGGSSIAAAGGGGGSSGGDGSIFGNSSNSSSGVNANHALDMKIVGMSWEKLQQNQQRQQQQHQTTMKLIYNSHVRSVIRFNVDIIDKYSQKALDCYRGFVQLFIKDPEAEKKQGRKKQKVAFGTVGTGASFSSLRSDSVSSILSRTKSKLFVNENRAISEEELIDGMPTEQNNEEIVISDEVVMVNEVDGKLKTSSLSHQTNLETPAPALKQFAFLNEVNKNLGNLKFLCELLIDLPKLPENEMTFTIRRTPFMIRPDGIIDHAFLEELSNHVGDDWIRLADQLNVRRIRIQALTTDRANKNPALDVLMTWIKRMPRSANKLAILIEALSACGRTDISKMLLHKRDEERKKSPFYSKEARMERAIKTVCSHSHLIYDWRLLCDRLNLTDDVIQGLQARHHNLSNRCYRAITNWVEMGGGGADEGVDGVVALIGRLRQARCHQLADIVEKDYKR